jgi:hypothetical protein
LSLNSRHGQHMDEVLYPETRIYPQILSRLTHSERVALRYLLARRSSRRPLKRDPVVERIFQLHRGTLFQKLQTRSHAELVLMTVKGRPHAPDETTLPSP